MNAAGRTRATLSLMALTVAVGAGAAAVLVPRAAVGTPMLLAAASATALGMVAGFLASIVYLRTRLGGTPPLATVARVAIAMVAATGAAHVVPGHGKIMGLAATAIAAVTYAAALLLTGEIGPDDRAKFARVLRKK